MSRYIVTALCLCPVLAFLGCQNVLDPSHPIVLQKIKELKEKISELEKNNRDTQKTIADTQAQITYQQNKISVLEDEKLDGKVNINYARRQIKDTFTELMQVIEESEDQLFDCLLGNAPIQREKSTFDGRRPLLLIDCLNSVDVDAVLFCGGELHANSPVEVQFCILRKSSQSNTSFIIESTSEPIRLPAGYHNVLFPRQKRLQAQRGNLIGLYVKPGNKIFYDDYGTGLCTDIILKKIIPGETAITLPPTLGLSQSSDKPVGKAFSFRLYGSSYLK